MPKNIKPEYEPKTLDQKLGYLVEEAGEVQAAVGKAIRWGLESSSPELPPEEQVTNRDWILAELVDLERAIGYVRAELIKAKAPTIKRDEDGDIVVTTFFDGKEQAVKFSQEAINDVAVEKDVKLPGEEPVQTYEWQGGREELPAHWYFCPIDCDWTLYKEGDVSSALYKDQIFAIENPTGKEVTEPKVVTEFPGAEKEVEPTKAEAVQVYEWRGCFKDVPPHWWCNSAGKWKHYDSDSCACFLDTGHLFALEDPSGKEVTEPMEVTEFPGQETEVEVKAEPIQTYEWQGGGEDLPTHWFCNDGWEVYHEGETGSALEKGWIFALEDPTNKETVGPLKVTKFPKS